MSSSSNVLSVEETNKRQYRLARNDLYSYPAERTVKSISTCPAASEIKVVKAAKSGGGEFVFTTQLSKTNFISNVFKLGYKLVFDVTLREWPQAMNTATPPVMADIDITQDNLVEKVFSNNSDICLAQHALSQGENYSALSFNSTSLGIVTEIPALTNITSPYYDSDQVNEYLMASQPDRFQSFEQYNGGKQTLKFIDIEGHVASTSISPENEQNLFSSKYQAGYTSRTPQWTYISHDAANKTVKVSCLFWKYIQFSVGATPNNESSLAGIERLDYTARFHGNLGARVFNTKTAGGAALNRYIKIEQDISDSDRTDAWMILKVISPPEYVRKTMIDSSTGLMKPYSIGIPRIDCKVYDKITAKPLIPTTFNVGGILLGSVPRSIYVALMKVRQDKGGATISTTPINFALINNLTINFDSVNTVFNDQKALSYVADSNGYQELEPLGRQIKGYPIKLNFGKDITLPRELVVGAGGSFNLSISGTFINQAAVETDYQLYVVPASDATFDFDGTSFSQSSGVYVPAALLDTTYFLRDLYSDSQEELEIIGAGRFGDAMKWLGRNAVKLVKGAWDNRDKIASTVGDISTLVKTVRGGKLQTYNTSGAGSETITLGAGPVKKNIFK